MLKDIAKSQTHMIGSWNARTAFLKKSISAAEMPVKFLSNYINPGYGLSLVDTLWNASSYRQPLEQEGNPMT